MNTTTHPSREKIAATLADTISERALQAARIHELQRAAAHAMIRGKGDDGALAAHRETVANLDGVIAGLRHLEAESTARELESAIKVQSEIYKAVERRLPELMAREMADRYGNFDPMEPANEGKVKARRALHAEIDAANEERNAASDRRRDIEAQQRELEKRFPGIFDEGASK